MNLSYRILNCDIFESYMALEGWENFPMLQSYTTSGEFSFMFKDYNYMIFDYTPSYGVLKAVCIYKVFGDTLYISLFEVSKKYQHKGIGSAAIERLLIETGVKKISLEARDNSAEEFWTSIGLKKIDDQTFCL